ncbi:MAG: hypothetical protein EAX96_13405 [Candidatus Lokiarchaeota archaeon]|nr:hypothetical protein [Candidatus Lokiarchaeota archaeon]
MGIKNKLIKTLQIKQRDIDQVIENISLKLSNIKKQIPELESNITNFSKKFDIIEISLTEIKNNWLRKTANARFLIEDIEEKVNRLSQIVDSWNKLKENFYFNQAKLEFETISSILPIYKMDIDEVPFEDAGLTVMGVILAFFPIIHVLCLPIGIALFFRPDYRAKIGGFSVLLIAAINLLYYILISFITF